MCNPHSEDLATPALELTLALTITLSSSVNAGEALLLRPQVQAPWKPSCPRWGGEGAQCGPNALESRDVWGISVPSVNNPAFSNLGVAAGCFHHCQTPHPHRQRLWPRAPWRGRRKCPPEGSVPKPLNGPIEALGRMTMGLLGSWVWSTEERGPGLGRQCWLGGQTPTSRAGSQGL